MIKRFISFFTALSMTFMLFDALNIAAAEDVHRHKVCADLNHVNCTHSEVEYEPFPTTLDGFKPDSFKDIIIEKDTNYYLTGDLTDETLSDTEIYIKNATVNFCLNGHTFDTKGITVSGNGVLNVCDCKTGGCLTSDPNYTYGVLVAQKGGTLNVYNGKIRVEKGIAVHSGGTDGTPSFTNIYGGEISGGSIMADNGGTLSIYGGTVKNDAEDRDGISVLNDAVVNVNGGTIVGGKFGIVANYTGSTVNINGGSVESRDNAALYIQNGVVCNITRGAVASTNHSAVYTVDGGTANINGGNLTSTSFPTVWIDNEGIANISGGNISNSDYKSYIWNSGTMDISGGVFSANMDKGYIRNYGSFSLQGSPTLINTYIWLSSDDNITVGGALTNNDTYTVYVDSSVPRTLTNGWDTYMTDKNTSQYFKSPYDTVKIAYRNNEAVMVYYYNITYDANGGSCSTQTVSADASDKLTSLAVPTREGYSFGGWFTEETGGEQVTTDTVFTNDTTIYAHWTCSDHIWGGTYEKDENEHWQICTRCSAESEKSAHTWNDGEVTAEPTETAEGVMTYRCTVCGAEKTEPIAKLEHEHTFSSDWSGNDTHHWHVATCEHTGEVDGMAEHIFFEGKCIVCQKSDPNYTQPTDTEPTVTEPPVTDPSDTEPAVTEPPVTDPSDTEPIVTEPPVTAPPYIPYFPSNNTLATAISSKKKPFLQNENGKIGWDVISDNILETSDGETVLVNMNGTTELPKNIVSDISGRDIDLSLIMNGGFVWTINGMGVTKTKTVDMSVRKRSVIPRSTVKDFAGDAKTAQLYLRHNGDFGFTAELTVDFGNKYSGMYANSYCYKSGNFEFGDSGEIVNGQAKLRFTHASSWLITIDTSPVLEDVSSAAAAHSAGTPIDMSNSASRRINIPDFAEEKKLRFSNKKRRYRILR